MNISVIKTQGYNVVNLRGDFLTEPEQKAFRTRIRELADGGARHIVVNLGEVGHINSCGLGSMVCAMVMMRKVGGDVRFAGVNADVGSLLEITHLNRVFQIYPGVREATLGPGL
ncbi:MAG TPA: STAS domain-containing protein [Bacteroidota bacterium]|nr:STAS domain-containing protein [Bacteroidota bacterium]